MRSYHALPTAGLSLLISARRGSSFTVLSPRTIGYCRQRHHQARQSLISLSDTKDSRDDDEKNPGFFEFMFNPYDSNIPKDLEAEIYRAEGNTPAAKERTQRVAVYAVVALTFVGCAFFNGFLTELRNGPLMEENPNLTLEDLGFGWVTASFLFSFLFTNKIGGGLALISGAASGMLAEAELDSRRKNAERIFEELERRRSEGSSPRKKQTKQKTTSKKKRKSSGKQKKRMGALSEVVLEERTAGLTEENAVTTSETSSKDEPPLREKTNEEEGEGIMDKLKGWYDKADSMAASQALLLNKELEDRGVLDKVTDETGLKVIGKEAAAKLKQEKDKSTGGDGVSSTKDK